MGAKDDHHRRLLAGDPRELACAVANFRTAIGVALEAVRARDPLEQPPTAFLRLYAARGDAVGTAVAVNDMREDEPQTEIACSDLTATATASAAPGDSSTAHKMVFITGSLRTV